MKKYIVVLALVLGFIGSFSSAYATPSITVTMPTYQCSDGLDNDADGFIDYPNDSDCIGTVDDDEANLPANITPRSTATSTSITTPLLFTRKILRMVGGGGIQKMQQLFTRNMWKGMRGSDIKKMQQLFNSDPDLRIAESGLGSPGNETEYYGFLTMSAVQNFQCKYGIACSGSPDSTGYGVVGPRTRTKLQEVFNQVSALSPIVPPESSVIPSNESLRETINKMLEEIKKLQKQIQEMQNRN